MSFADFAACAREWSQRRLTVRVPLAPPPAAAPHPAPQLQSEFESLLDWAWLAAEVQEPLRLGRPLACALHASSTPSLSPLRYEPLDTLLCQVRGRSRVLLVSPAHSYGGLYPFPVAHPYDGYAMVDPGQPQLGEWPGFTNVRGQAAVLAPGELLLVPRGWWAQLQALGEEATQGEHSLLRLQLHPGGRVRSAAAAAPAIGRRCEQLAVEEEGIAGARGWLERLARGEEAPPHAELATPKGYRRIRLTTAIWTEVAGLAPRLTREQGAAFLAQLIDRRLQPTPWLNANFREPLYLTGASPQRRAPPPAHPPADVPVQYPDTRSEWEQRFPALFTRKLELEGYEVSETPVSVLNPAHPQFIGRAKGERA